MHSQYNKFPATKLHSTVMTTTTQMMIHLLLFMMMLVSHAEGRSLRSPTRSKDPEVWNCTDSVDSIVQALTDSPDMIVALQQASDPIGLPPHIIQFSASLMTQINGTAILSSSENYYFPASLFIGWISDDYLRVRTLYLFDVRYRDLPPVRIGARCKGFDPDIWHLNFRAAFRLAVNELSDGRVVGPGQDSIWVVPFVDLRTSPMCYIVDPDAGCRADAFASYTDDILLCYELNDGADIDGKSSVLQMKVLDWMSLAISLLISVAICFFAWHSLWFHFNSRVQPKAEKNEKPSQKEEAPKKASVVDEEKKEPESISVHHRGVILPEEVQLRILGTQVLILDHLRRIAPKERQLPSNAEVGAYIAFGTAFPMDGASRKATGAEKRRKADLLREQAGEKFTIHGHAWSAMLFITNVSIAVWIPVKANSLDGFACIVGVGWLLMLLAITCAVLIGIGRAVLHSYQRSPIKAEDSETKGSLSSGDTDGARATTPSIPLTNLGGEADDKTLLVAGPSSSDAPAGDGSKEAKPSSPRTADDSHPVAEVAPAVPVTGIEGPPPSPSGQPPAPPQTDNDDKRNAEESEDAQRKNRTFKVVLLHIVAGGCGFMVITNILVWAVLALYVDPTRNVPLFTMIAGVLANFYYLVLSFKDHYDRWNEVHKKVNSHFGLENCSSAGYYVVLAFTFVAAVLSLVFVSYGYGLVRQVGLAWSVAEAITLALISRVGVRAQNAEKYSFKERVKHLKFTEKDDE